jgi:hypothetical protein
MTGPTKGYAAPADRTARRFWPLFAVQTAAVCALVYLALPAFVAIADSLGHAVELLPHRIIGMVAALTVFHAAYWSRLRWAPMPTMPKNILLTHAFLFLSRLSFVFAAAFFSLVSFRHLPALTSSPEVFEMAARGALLLATLFSLFCYSLEFDRIGKAMDDQAEDGRL